jgi:hypothetical protein
VFVPCEIVLLVGGIHIGTSMEKCLHLLEVGKTKVSRKVNFLSPPTAHPKIILIVAAPILVIAYFRVI